MWSSFIPNVTLDTGSAWHLVEFARVIRKLNWLWYRTAFKLNHIASYLQISHYPVVYINIRCWKSCQQLGYIITFEVINIVNFWRTYFFTLSKRRTHGRQELRNHIILKKRHCDLFIFNFIHLRSILWSCRPSWSMDPGSSEYSTLYVLLWL